jgi:hypothetical protein
MTEKEGTGRVVTGAAILSGGSFRDSRTEGEQSFSLEQGEHELKAQTVTHNLQLERMRTEQELEEARKENDARRVREAKDDEDRRGRERIVFWLVIVGTIAGLLIGSAASFLGRDDVTQPGGKRSSRSLSVVWWGTSPGARWASRSLWPTQR